jgi:hypothetical protein
MEEKQQQNTSGSGISGPVSQVAREAHERAAGTRKTRTPRPTPIDLASARERMETSLFNDKAARTHCGTCGAQGQWRIETTREGIRHCVCLGCGVGRTKIPVTADEVTKALGL